MAPEVSLVVSAGGASPDLAVTSPPQPATARAPGTGAGSGNGEGCKARGHADGIWLLACGRGGWNCGERAPRRGAGVTTPGPRTDGTGRSRGSQARRTRACVRVQLIMPALDDLRPPVVEHHHPSPWPPTVKTGRVVYPV